MYKSLFDISRLLYKYKTGALTDEGEIKRFNEWLSASPLNKKVLSKVVSSENFARFRKQIGNFDVEKAWYHFQLAQRKKRRRNIRNAFLKYAAIIAVAVSLPAGGYWWYITSASKTSTPHTEVAQKKTISPGTNKAILTLSSGDQIELEEDETLSPEQIAAYAGRHSSYTGAGVQTYSTIETPVGGEYRLTLSDGSGVNLNSRSKLRFPDTFAHAKREIELLDGEIYLDVRRVEGSPFFVRLEGMTIKVTGTSFNVSTYDSVYQATLVKGKIEIEFDTGELYRLNASEQLSFRPGKEAAQIRQVDTDLFTSWVDGRFVFRDETIESILKKMARWYNFSALFESPELKEYRFGVHINKYGSIDPFLTVLESTGKLRFEVKGDTILVKKGDLR